MPGPNNAPRDKNRVPSLLGKGSVTGKTVPVEVDEATGRLYATVTGSVSQSDQEILDTVRDDNGFIISREYEDRVVEYVRDPQGYVKSKNITYKE